MYERSSSFTSSAALGGGTFFFFLSLRTLHLTPGTYSLVFSVTLYVSNKGVLILPFSCLVALACFLLFFAFPQESMSHIFSSEKSIVLSVFPKDLFYNTWDVLIKYGFLYKILLIIFQLQG